MLRLKLIIASSLLASFTTACGQSQTRIVDTGIDCGRPFILFESDKAKMIKAKVSDDFFIHLKNHNDKYKKCLDSKKNK